MPNRQLIKLARDRVQRQCNKRRRREDGQSAPDPIRATTTTHGYDLEHALQPRHPGWHHRSNYSLWL
jgi:hypothetical protein